jgi:hypothetical protein
MSSKGQALTEMIVAIPLLLLVGWLATEGCRLLALKGILSAVAADTAHSLSSSELFDNSGYARDFDNANRGSSGDTNSVTEQRLLAEEKRARALLQPYARLFGWNPSAIFPMRLYATRHQDSNSPGFSSQINVCIPLVATLVFSHKSSDLDVHRNCLGFFERNESIFTNISGNVRVRVAAFAPRMASYEIFHLGMAFPKVWRGVDRIPADTISGSESSSDNAVLRVKAAITRSSL